MPTPAILALDQRPSVWAILRDGLRFEVAAGTDYMAAVENQIELIELYVVHRAEPLREYLGRPDLFLTKGRGKKTRRAELYTAVRIQEAEAEHRRFLDELSR